MSKFAVVESHFEYKGHDCICLFTVKGYRCGYVSVDDNRDFWDYDLDCHCGLSFGASPLLKDFKPKSDMYIGFDCGHSCDGYDYGTALKYGLINEKRYNELIEMEILSPSFLQPIRSLEYVEYECRKIVDQLEARIRPK